MSLTKVNLISIVKKQFQFKCRSYSGMFISLIALQLLGILLSVIGGSSYGMGSDNLSVDINYASANNIIVFTMIWAFISAILITTKVYREDDFTFITNRLSNNLANTAFLFTCSVIGGVTAYLSGFLVRVIIRLTSHATLLPGSGLPPTLQELLSGLSVSILYLLVFSTLGYLIGTIVQLHRIFIVALPIAFISMIILTEKFWDRNILLRTFEFYFQESSMMLFIFKVVITTVLLFAGATILSDRQEVRL